MFFSYLATIAMATWKIFDQVLNSLYSKEHVKMIETLPREIGFVLWGNCQNLLYDPRSSLSVVRGSSCQPNIYCELAEYKRRGLLKQLRPLSINILSTKRNAKILFACSSGKIIDC